MPRVSVRSPEGGRIAGVARVEPDAARQGSPARVRPPADARSLLDIQRGAGNAAAAGLVGGRAAGGGAVVQRQPVVDQTEIPLDLQTTPDYRALAEDELRERYDRIVDVLAGFNESTPETAALEQQAAEIGTELGRRSALAAGRTFTDEDIERSRGYFRRNARTERDSCIVALNKGLRLVTGESTLPTTPKSIEATMERVAGSGHASEAREIAFQARSGRITRGGARPDRLNESVWDAVVEMSAGDPGWSVFTMSLLDGYHSVTLTLDAANPAAPRIYWSDQWQSKRGWKEYSRAGLDTEVTRLVRQWWDGQAEGKKHTTVVRLWRVYAAPQGAAGP